MSSISSTGESGNVGVVDLEFGVVDFEVSVPLTVLRLDEGSPRVVDGRRSVTDRGRLVAGLLRMIRPSNM